MGIDLVHQLAGKHVVYTLALEGGRRYVGQTQNIEKRLAEHLEKRGAKWTQEHKVIDVISCRVCENEEDASALEVALTSLHMSKVGANRARGGRYNMCQDLQRPPKYWENIEEEVLQEAKSVVQTYESNEIAPPYPALCFKNERDPTGKLRHLAALA